ncbi:MAG: transposase [Planctomycetota bacterium]
MKSFQIAKTSFTARRPARPMAFVASLSWVIPPDADGAYVARMEDVLEVYQRPHDPSAPVVCMDEQPVQLVKEVRQPLPATPSCPKRVDYEYERNGTANIFMFTEPLTGWRHVEATQRRTKIDWALEIRDLLDGHYRSTSKVVLVMDNLNTHNTGLRSTKLFHPLKRVVLPSG